MKPLQDWINACMKEEKIALISVSDKTNLVPFCQSLVNDFGYRLISTGGTAQHLIQAQLPVTEISDYTHFPELMDGRLKTLHPKVHGGLLCNRTQEKHKDQAKEHEILLIDLLVVNLYPFEQTIARKTTSFKEAIEQIDIGGPAMLRSAAKNHAAVTVVYDPDDYDRVLMAFRDEERLPLLRAELALKVFQRTSDYDATIADYLSKNLKAKDEPDLQTIAGFPEMYTLRLERSQSLRYGENPHQQATLYGRFFDCYEQLQGKELSFNNILDITAATRLIGEFERPSVGILKHNNPCGVASADTLADAWEKALATDRQAPFGGIIIVNQTLDDDLAAKIHEIFCEVIIAPRFTTNALNRFRSKKNLRLMIAKEGQRAEALQDVRSVVGGLLVQDYDQKRITPQKCTVVTQRQPSAKEWDALIFGWHVVKHVKSNAIVFASGEETLGIGAGQMSRIDSAKIAIWKAREANLSLKGSIVASDAFFPFADGLEVAASTGATSAIQPGGSVRDEEVIEAANKHNMAMVFTHTRHFRH